MGQGSACAAAAAAVLAIAGSSSAGMLLVDSGEPENPALVAGIFYDDTDEFQSQFIAVEIEFEEAVELSRMEFHFQGGAGNQLTVHLTDHLGKGADQSSVLQTLSLTGPGTPGAWTGADVNLTLDAGVYFLVFSAPAQHNMGMNVTAPNSVGTHYVAIGFSEDGIFGEFAPASTNWFANPGLSVGIRLYSDPIPTPGGLGAFALAGMIAARRRR